MTAAPLLNSDTAVNVLTDLTSAELIEIALKRGEGWNEK